MPEGAPDYAFQDSWELGGYTGIPKQRPFSDDFQREMIHGYRACVSYIDTQVGRLLDHLDESGLSKNTVVVLWGDHGWHLGDHGMFCKHTNYEQAVRSPLIFASPHQTAKGTRSESPVEFVDIFPTLCALVDLPIPGCVEGLSLKPVLDDPKALVREAALGQYPRGTDKMGYTLRDKRYRYVKWIRMNFLKGDHSGAVEAVELYDYHADPNETTNLAADPACRSVVENFERILNKRGIAQDNED